MHLTCGLFWGMTARPLDSERHLKELLKELLVTRLTELCQGAALCVGKGLGCSAGARCSFGGPSRAAQHVSSPHYYRNQILVLQQQKPAFSTSLLWKWSFRVSLLAHCFLPSQLYHRAFILGPCPAIAQPAETPCCTLPEPR